MAQQNRIAAPPFSWVPPLLEQAHLGTVDAFARAASALFLRRENMTAQDLPATTRALAVIVAVALVATALAPLLFAAARVVA
jgi:hypothetical protein